MTTNYNKKQIVLIAGIALFFGLFIGYTYLSKPKIEPFPEVEFQVNGMPFYMTYNTKKDTITLTHDSDCLVEYESNPTKKGEFGKVKVSCPEFLDKLVVNGRK